MKKKPISFRKRASVYSIEASYANLLTKIVSFDFKLLALFLWMMLRLANLSSIALIFGNISVATVLSVVERNLRTALRAVLA